MDPWGHIARLSRQEVRELQNRKLHQFINSYVYPFSPHYQKIFDEHKINPRKIKTVDDLKHIPLTSKLDFVGCSKRKSVLRILSSSRIKIKSGGIGR